MKHLTLVYMANVVILFSCGRDKVGIAYHLNKRATEMFARNLRNPDSVRVALKLVDSAIQIDRNVNYFFTKVIIERKLGKFQQALESCNVILSKRANDFRASLYKGYLFEDMNRGDSMIYWYKRALELLSLQKNRGDKFGTEYLRIVLTGLANDSINYQILLRDFRKNYSTHAGFDEFYKKLLDFHRNEFLDRDDF